MKPECRCEICQEKFTVTFRSLPGSWRGTPLSRFKGLLKIALRGFGYRATRVSQEQKKT
jgi:hypothetical protein